jgi:hypothetical protein
MRGLTNVRYWCVVARSTDRLKAKRFAKERLSILKTISDLRKLVVRIQHFGVMGPVKSNGW